MSGVKVTNERSSPPITAVESVEAEVDGDNEDWEPGGSGVSELDQWKQPVRAATTANVTIATALNAGDTIDGVTLAAGDRVLVKDQSSALQNGIYVVSSSPERAVDLDDDDEVLGAVVYVIAGSTNAGTTWAVTNTAATTVDTDAIDWAAFGGGSGSIPAGTYELAIEGGQSVIKAHGSMGSTETIDPTDGNVHTGTLNADVTYTLNAPAGSGACEIEFQRTGSGGPWTETWPGSVTWSGGSAPTPPTSGNTTIVILRSLDGGTTWLGIPVGGSGPDLSAIDFLVGTASGLLSAEIVVGTTPGGELGGTWPSPTVDTTHSGSSHAATQAAAEATAAAALAAHIASTPSSSGGEHVHVAGETHLSDGSTTTYTLDEAFEPGSVEAWNTTTLAYLTVTETQPDQASVSAAGSAGDKITFSYAASLA